MNKFVLHIALVAALFACLCKQAYGFEYTISPTDNAFKKTKYHFTVDSFIDGRYDAGLPIGYIPSFSYKPQSVGNDSLANSMNDFFKTHKEPFDTANKIIVVLNQLNLYYFQDFSMLTGKIQDIKIFLSLDYYKIDHNKCALIYQQFIKSTTSVKFIMSRSKGVDISFSNALHEAFANFETQLESGTANISPDRDLSEILSYATAKNDIKFKSSVADGVYFSCKDLFMNRPSIFSNAITIDNTEIADGKISLKGNKYVVNQAYAIVSNNKIYVNLHDNIYRSAQADNNGQLLFPDAGQYFISRSSMVAVIIAPGHFGLIGALASVAFSAIASKASEEKEYGNYVIFPETGAVMWESSNAPGSDQNDN